nr:MAG TPA: hypothetical protein [Caudoviricetes sp.]
MQYAGQTVKGLFTRLKKTMKWRNFHLMVEQTKDCTLLFLSNLIF